MGTVYPVGSLYFGTQSTCPLQALGIGTWQKVGSSLITSVNTSVPVKGNGKTLGLTDGTNQWGLVNNGSSATWEMYNTNASGTAIGTNVSGTNGPNTNKTVGITANPEKSGIVGTVTRTVLTVNIWKRTA